MPAVPPSVAQSAPVTPPRGPVRIPPPPPPPPTEEQAVQSNAFMDRNLKVDREDKTSQSSGSVPRALEEIPPPPDYVPVEAAAAYVKLDNYK